MLPGVLVLATRVVALDQELGRPQVMIMLLLLQARGHEHIACHHPYHSEADNSIPSAPIEISMFG